MASIAIITDTDSSLPVALAARYQIHQVPIGINFGTQTFEAAVNINDTQLFERIDRHKQLPKTSAPSVGTFKETFQHAFDKGCQTVVCICVSSKVSSTYNAALSAREMLPEYDIEVIDSLNLSIGQGFMALAAAESVQRGEPKEKVIAAALEISTRMQYFGALSTLKYLAMSGRVGHLAAGLSSLMNIKPILTTRNGKLEMLEKIRTRRKSLARLIELVKQFAAQRTIERMAIIHVTALAEANEFEKQIRVEVECPRSILTVELGPGLSVHTGAGLIGVSVVLKA